MISQPLFLVVLVTVLGTCLGDDRLTTHSVSGDVPQMLTSIFTAREAPFNKSRHPISGRQEKITMQTFIENRLEVIKVVAQQKGFNSSIETVFFNTTLQYGGKLTTVQAANVIYVLKGSVRQSEDEPLMLLANYDTGEDSNQVNEGSGVAALLVLTDLLVDEMDLKKYKPKHSIIFAFTDVAYKKYSGNHASEGVTGATNITRYWLPKFMNDRKSFRGVIVLDNIMNYNENDQSQLVTNLGLDKSFPDAYAKISEANFAGNFLGLLHRDDALDKPLVKKIDQAWRKSLNEPMRSETSDGGVLLDPRLLKFTFVTDIFASASVNDFLNSEQSAFWNHHITSPHQGQYPAVTLTDTRLHRDSVCRLHCSIGAMMTTQNLAFMRRTINTLLSLVVEMQTDNGAMSNLHASSFLLLAPLLAYVTNTFFNKV